jgi:hypothetical protein
MESSCSAFVCGFVLAFAPSLILRSLPTFILQTLPTQHTLHHFIQNGVAWY